MNKIDEKEIKGILNFIGKSKDFSSEYMRVKNFKVYSNQIDLKTLMYGVICWFVEDRDISLKVNISMRSFLNIKNYLEGHTENIQTAHDMFSTISNFYDLNFVAAIVPYYKREHYSTYLILEKDGEFLSVNCYFSDIVCMVQKMNMPVYIHKEIVKEMGIPVEALNEFLNEGETNV